jgi:hypothetical protein
MLLHKQRGLAWPVAETETHWITLGLAAPSCGSRSGPATATQCRACDHVLGKLIVSPGSMVRIGGMLAS